MLKNIFINIILKNIKKKSIFLKLKQIDPRLYSMFLYLNDFGLKLTSKTLNSHRNFNR